MGNVYYFLVTAFTWLQYADGNILVHLCQLTFTEFTAHSFLVHTANKVPNMTPYRSGFPIDSIPPVNPLDPDPPHQKRVYQNIVGCINWLETCTRLDIAHELIFLSSYRNSPHPQHYKEAVHALKYPTSTNEYLHSKSSSKIQAFNNFPHHHDGAFPVRMPPTYSLLRRQLGWSIW